MIDRKKATKAIILARVSSKEQEDGYSIDAQTYRLEEYCMRKGLEVLQIFKFSESSTTGNREKFKEAIEFARKQKEVVAVISDKVDRLQRSYKETPLLNDLIEREKIELHFYTENCVIHKHSTSQEKMMWNMFVMMAQSYVDSLRDNVNRSIAQKLRVGEWVSIAPIGYLHEKGYKNAREKGKIVIDEHRAPLIKKLFEEYATGSHTLMEIVNKTKEWGLSNSRGNKQYLSRSNIYDILRNPFYYGIMRMQKTGKEYPHIYQPIITKDLFDQCQKVRLGWNKKPFKWGGKEYVFRGLIKCAATDKVVTALTKKKNYENGGSRKWTYLRTYDPKNTKKMLYVKEENILAEVEKVLASMYIKPESLTEYISHIKSSSHIEQEYHKNRIKELRTEHAKVKTRMDKLTDLFLDGDIDKQTHEEKRQQLVQKQQDISNEIENHNKADNNFTETLISLVELASGALKTFKSSTTEEKRRLVNLVFENLKLNGHKLVYSLRPPFDRFVNLPKTGEWYALEDSNL